MNEKRMTGSEPRRGGRIVDAGRRLMRWLGTYTVQRQIRIMLVGTAITGATMMYMIFVIPLGDTIGLRDSIISVAGTVVGVTMMLWPLIHVCFAAVTGALGAATDAITVHIVTPSHKWLVKHGARRGGRGKTGTARRGK